MGVGYFGKTLSGRNAEGEVTHYTFEWTDGQHIRFPKIKGRIAIWGSPE